jgi:hypothetical protein
MGQSIEGRLARLKWLGDMEPEYEEMLERMNLDGAEVEIPSEDRSSLHWAVIANSLSRFSGGSGGMNLAIAH